MPAATDAEPSSSKPTGSPRALHGLRSPRERMKRSKTGSQDAPSLPAERAASAGEAPDSPSGRKRGMSLRRGLSGRLHFHRSRGSSVEEPSGPDGDEAGGEADRPSDADIERCLVPVHDWWCSRHKQLTFHAGEASTKSEERKDLQFLALSKQLPGTVAVYEWWDRHAKRLSYHPAPAREHEEQREIRFYGLRSPMAAAVAVREFWNPALRQATVHTGEPWAGEQERGVLFYAFRADAAETTGEETLHLEPGGQRELHRMHALTPLRLSIWLGGDSYETATLHGRLTVTRPGDVQTEQSRPDFYGGEGDKSSVTKLLTLHPPHQPNSPLSLKLRVQLKAGVAGSCAVCVASPLWFANSSAHPICLYDAVPTGGAVLRLDEHHDAPHPFSLLQEGGSARLGLGGVDGLGAAPVVESVTRSRSGKQAIEAMASKASAAFHQVGATAIHNIESVSGQLSRSFSVEAVGNETTLEAARGKGGAAELSVSISRSSGKLGAANAIIVTVHDRLVMRNRTALQLEWRQAPLPDEMAAAQHEPLNLERLLPTDGKPAPVHWEARGNPRMLVVRPRGMTHKWSAPFSPETIGEQVLKLRPAEPNTATGVPADERETLYLRCSTSMNGNRRTLLLRAVDVSSGHALPYHVANTSGCLLAFRQVGCEQWDLLAAGESCDYVVDAPIAPKQLELRARDPHGRWVAAQMHEAGFSLEKLGKAQALKVEEASKHDGLLERSMDAAAATIAAVAGGVHRHAAVGAVPHDEPVLMSAACKLRYGAEPRACIEGWLCVTDAHVTFIAFSDEGWGGDEERAPTTGMDSFDGDGDSWLGASDLPLSFERLEAPTAGKRPGELLLRTTVADGRHRVLLRGLRDRDGVAERLNAALHSWRHVQEAHRIAQQVHEVCHARHPPPAENDAAEDLSGVTLLEGGGKHAMAVGTRVKHATRGLGTVTEVMEDGRTKIMFADGSEHKYKASSMHKISAMQRGRATAAAAAARFAAPSSQSSSDVLGSDISTSEASTTEESKSVGALFGSIATAAARQAGKLAEGSAEIAQKTSWATARAVAEAKTEANIAARKTRDVAERIAAASALAAKNVAASTSNTLQISSSLHMASAAWAKPSSTHSPTRRSRRLSFSPAGFSGDGDDDDRAAREPHTAPPENMDDSLIGVYEFWDSALKQLVVHGGVGAHHEEKRELQFVALSERLPGCVAISSFFSRETKRLTLHAGKPREGEELRGSELFYAFQSATEGAVPVREFWSDGLRQPMVHIGEPREGEVLRRPALFHAFPNWQRVHLARMPEAKRELACVLRVQAAYRGRKAREASSICTKKRHAKAAALDALLGRPPHAASLVGVGGARLSKRSLVEAARQGDVARMGRLLRAGADPDVLEKETGLGALHAAAMRNQLAALRLLLEAGANVEQGAHDRRNTRPLHSAVTATYGVGLPGVLALLEAGADPTAVRADGATPITLALARRGAGVTIHRALVAAQAEWARATDKPKTSQVRRAHTPPHADTHAHPLACTSHLLSSPQSRITCPSQQLQKLSVAACPFSHHERATSVDAGSETHAPPSSERSSHEHHQARHSHDRESHHPPSQQTHASAGGEPIQRAVVVHAAAAGKTGRVHELLRRGVDPRSLDEHGASSVHVACARGDLPLLRTLVGAGADVNLPAHSPLAPRPLHVAAQAGSAACVQYLLEQRADPSLSDRKGWLPLERCGEALTARDVLRAVMVHGLDALDTHHHDGGGGGGGGGGKRAASLSSQAHHLNRGARDYIMHSHSLSLSHRAASASGSAAHLHAGGGAHERPLLHALLLKDGPVREVRLSAGAVHEEGVAGDKEEDAAKDASESAGLLLSLRLAGVGISLIDEEPCEILHAALQGVELRSSTRWDVEQSLELCVRHLQIDSTIANTKYPVLLAPHDASEGIDEGSHGKDRQQQQQQHQQDDGVLRLSVTHNMRWAALLYLEYVGVGLQPLRLQLEQNIAARLMRLTDRVMQAAIDLGDAFEPLMALEPPSRPGAEGGNASAAAASTKSTLEADEAELEQAPLELFLRELHIHPISIEISLQVEPMCDEPALQQFHPTAALVGLAQQLVAQPLNTRVALNALLLDDALFESTDSLVSRVVWHYIFQGLHAVYRLAIHRLGSLDELGNLNSLFQGISGGLQTFFYEPRKGLVKSPQAFVQGVARGSAGLAGGVVGGTGAAFFGFASAMTRHAGTLADKMAMDSQWQLQQRALQQRHAAGTGQGLLLGVQALGEGFLEGGKGVFYDPVAGAMDDGAKGFVKGLGTGLAGVFAKPISGVAAFASKTTEGIANDAKKVTTTGSRELQLQMRVRQPRVIGSDGVLCAYPRTPPLEVLIENDKLEEQGKKLAAARQSSRAGAASAPSS